MTGYYPDFFFPKLAKEPPAARPPRARRAAR
jgi:hypothetical protein